MLSKVRGMSLGRTAVSRTVLGVGNAEKAKKKCGKFHDERTNKKTTLTNYKSVSRLFCTT